MKAMSALPSVVAFTALCVYGHATQPSSDIKRPIIDLGYVKYRGITNSTAGITYFRGVQ